MACPGAGGSACPTRADSRSAFWLQAPGFSLLSALGFSAGAPVSAARSSRRPDFALLIYCDLWARPDEPRNQSLLICAQVLWPMRDHASPPATSLAAIYCGCRVSLALNLVPQLRCVVTAFVPALPEGIAERIHSRWRVCGLLTGIFWISFSETPCRWSSTAALAGVDGAGSGGSPAARGLRVRSAPRELTIAYLTDSPPLSLAINALRADPV